MATLISGTTGNLTSAGTWKLASSTAALDSQVGNTSLSTSAQDSSAFVLAAVTVDAVAIKLGSRAVGTPTNTITVTLRNSTTSTDSLSLTINVSDLDACSTSAAGSEGGWYVFKFGSTHTPNGTDSYKIRALLNSTSTAVNLWRDGTALNWSRQVLTTTTQAPVAGDNLIIAGEHTGAGTGNSFVVTMNQTATTDYGTASTTEGTPAVAVCKRGTLAYGNTASTDYYFKISGYLAVYSGGTFTIGTVASPIPRTGTAVLEFDCAVTADFGLVAYNNSTFTAQGLSRTSGKNQVWALLTANLAAAGTSATIDTDTGWLSGDLLAIASTSRTPGDSETITLNTNAGASSLAWTGGVTNAHLGSTTEPMQAEVILLTRNVMFRSSLSTAYTFSTMKATATADIDWVDYRYIGSSSFPGILVNTGTGGTCSVSYCTFRDSGIRAVSIVGTGTGTVTVEHSVAYRVGVTASLQAGFIDVLNAGSNSNHNFNDLVGIYTPGGVNYMFSFIDINASTITNLRGSGASRYAFSFVLNSSNNDGTGKTLGPFVAHSCGDIGWVLSGMVNTTINGFTSWRNASYGINIQGLRNVTFTTCKLWGNASYNINLEVSNVKVTIQDLQLYADSTFSTTSGINTSNSVGFNELRVEKADFGTASGTKIAHASSEINLSVLPVNYFTINDGLFTAPALFNLAGYGALGSYYNFGRYGRAAAHRVYTYQGSIIYETTTFDVTPSQKLTPFTASYKLETNAGQRGRGFLVPVASGATKTISVMVRKDGTYNGNAPRLIQKATGATGIFTDAVLDTLTVGVNTWETLTATTASAVEDGIFEFVVDCDGTAGNVYVDTWSAV